MQRILAAIGLVSLAALAGTASATASSHNPADKITICHATGSDSNPYVPITISLNGLNGHANANHQLSEDIIPPNDGSIVPDGQNWTADGQALHRNGCVAATDTSTDNGKKITICHATGSAKNPYVRITISLNGLNGHANANHQLSEDIIPPNDGSIVPGGQNWTAEGQSIYNNDCREVTVTETTPPAPPAGEVVVPKRNPVGAVVGGPAAGAAQATNPGYGVQTAVSETPAEAPWLAGFAALLAAGLAVAGRRAMAGGKHGGR